MNARMLVEFVDGSKTMIEMVAIANCTGLVPDVPGMHGPAATREELSSVLMPKSHGGVLPKSGCVDYSIGKGVAPGVFCIVETDHPRVLERMIDLKVGRARSFPSSGPIISPAWKCRSRRPRRYCITGPTWCRWIIRWRKPSPSPSAISRPAKPWAKSARQNIAPGP